MACKRSRRTYSELLLLKRGISELDGSGPISGLEFSRQLLLLEIFCGRAVKGFRLDDAWMDLFVFCITCRRGVALWLASDAGCLHDLGEDECSRAAIAVPKGSMAAP